MQGVQGWVIQFGGSAESAIADSAFDIVSRSGDAVGDGDCSRNSTQPSLKFLHFWSPDSVQAHGIRALFMSGRRVGVL